MTTPLLNGRYRIVSSLGAGGMGEVFLADDIQLHRRVAITFLHPASDRDELARERLRREVLPARLVVEIAVMIWRRRRFTRRSQTVFAGAVRVGIRFRAGTLRSTPSGWSQRPS